MDKNTSWSLREHCQMEEKALSKDRVSFVEWSELCGVCVWMRLHVTPCFWQRKEINTLCEHYDSPLTCCLHLFKGSVFILIIFTVRESEEIYNYTTFKACETLFNWLTVAGHYRDDYRFAKHRISISPFFGLRNFLARLEKRNITAYQESWIVGYKPGVSTLHRLPSCWKTKLSKGDRQRDDW